jgi:uncharacterized protein YukJ
MTTSVQPTINRSHRQRNFSSDQFARVIGRYQNEHLQHAKSSHLVLDLEVNGNPSFEADVNIHSTDRSNVQYAVTDQILSAPLTVSEGIDTNVTLSYQQLGLKESDFVSVGTNDFYAYLSPQASHCDLIIIYGYLYRDGTKQGIHDIHMNTTGDPHYQQRDHDGAIGFYFEGVKPHIQWVFIKFDTQTLPHT